MYSIGLDYHLRTSTYHILDPKGNMVKAATVRGGWQKLLDELGKFKHPFQIVFEATCGYGHLHEQLAKIARKVVVAHPKHLKLIYGSMRKNDRFDAAKLAKLLHMDMIPTVHIPSQETRTWRELIEFRRRQVDKRTRVKNQIRTLLRTYGISKPRTAGGLWTAAGQLWLAGVQWPTSLAAMRCEMLQCELQEADQRVARLTQQLDQIAKTKPGIALLRTIPGVGPRTAETILAYIDDPHRFARSKQIGTYFGLVPCQDSSAKVNRLGHITREGPGTARKMLIESTWQAIRRNDHLRQHFERVTGDRKNRRKIALVATAHHLLRCMLMMLKTGQTWDPPGDRPVAAEPGRTAA